MASLTNLINPSTEQSLQGLDQNAQRNQQTPNPGNLDYAEESAYDAIINGPSYNLGAKAYDKYIAKSPKLAPEDLNMLYPEVPPETWGTGADAFQAELINDRFKEARYKKQLRDFVAGVSSTDSGAGSELVTDTVGTLAEMGGGLVDPAIFMAFQGAGHLANGAKMFLAKPLMEFAPSFMKTIAGSRLNSTVAHEIAINVLGETGMLQAIHRDGLDDFTKTEQQTVGASLMQSLGNAMVFSGMKYAGGKVAGRIFPTDEVGSEYVQKTQDESFSKTKDKVNATVNSDNANKAAFQNATAHSATSEMGDGNKSSASERMSDAAFKTDNKVKFKTNESKWFGVYDQESGKADYTGDRFGDNHTFVDSPEAAQGTFDMFARDGRVYSIYGHNGNLPLIDLEKTSPEKFPDILDLIEQERGHTFLDKVKDDASLADVFRAVNEEADANGSSGEDMVKMYDKINKILKSEGYSGTTHIEQRGETAHTVMSVFHDDMKMTDLSELHKGISDTKIEAPDASEPNPRTEAPVATLEGNELPVEDTVPFDYILDNDPEVVKGYEKLNDPKYLEEVRKYTQEDPTDPAPIQETAKEISDDIKQSIKQLEEIASRKNVAEDVSMQNVEGHLELEKELDAVKEEIKNNPLEHEDQIPKAIENCLRKGL